MKTLPSCLCILGFATASLGGTTVLLDNVGAADGSNIYGGYGGTNQIFGGANAAYDCGYVHQFPNPAGLSATSVDLAFGGHPLSTTWVGPDLVSGYSVNFYSGTFAGGDLAACNDLNGDVSTLTLLPGDVTITLGFAGPFGANAHPDGSHLMSSTLGGGMNLLTGENNVSILLINDIATNGQCLVAQAVTGTSLESTFANPGLAWSGTACEASTLIAALKVNGGVADPCDTALPTLCNGDVSGPLGTPDGYVNVTDLLMVISNWNHEGDGTYRPQGDCYPKPNGDCAVNVGDLLKVIGQWGNDCVPKGACCYADAMCDEDTYQAECDSAGGWWLGEGIDCSPCVAGACCNTDGTCNDYSETGCSDAGGTWQGNGTDCATTTCIEAPPNNECSGAIDVSLTPSVSISTNGATSTGPADFGEDGLCEVFSHQENYNDIYYTYTAQCEGNVTVSLCDTVDYDSRVQIYAGWDCTLSDQVACNDDGEGCSDYTSSVTFAATQDDIYLIRIGGYAEGETGSGTMDISCADYQPGACCLGPDTCNEVETSVLCEQFGGAWQGDGTFCIDTDCDPTPDNDLCEEATLAVEGVNPFDTTAASGELAAPDDALCSSTYLDWPEGAPDVFFYYIPAEDGLITLDTCDIDSYDTSMVVMEGDCTADVYACNGDDSSGLFTDCQDYFSAIVDLPVTGGNNYIIRLSGWNGDSGVGNLTLSFVAADAEGACCVAGTCVGDAIVNDECVNVLNGLWYNGLLCSEVDCPQPWTACDAGSTSELDLTGSNGEDCICIEDQFDSELDCNGGVNHLVTPSYTAYATGEMMCGVSTVYVDGPTGGTYRDLDWWTNADVQAGGDFQVTLGSQASMLIVIWETALGEGTGWQNGPGFTLDEVIDGVIASPNNVIWTGCAEWDTSWICGSGFEEYEFSLAPVTP